MNRVIHISSDEAAHRVVLRALAESPLPFDVERAVDPTAAAALAGDCPVDAVLVALPTQAAALDVIGECRITFAAQPLIVLTDSADFAFARAALRAGVQDVVLKSDGALAVLPRILLYAIERAGAEARREQLQTAFATLAAVLDAVLGGTSEAVLQTDAQGTIERSSPGAAELLGFATLPADGVRLSTCLQRQDAARLQAFLDAAAISPEAGFGPAATFNILIDGVTRVLEFRALPVGVDTAEPPRLLELNEVTADFAVDLDATNDSNGGGDGDWHDGGRERPPASAPAGPRARSGSASTVDLVSASNVRPVVMPQTIQTEAAGDDLATLEQPDKAASDAPREAAAASSAQADRPLELIEQLRRTATWRLAISAGDDAPWGFPVPDQASVAVMTQLAKAIRDDLKLALAFDTLQINAWQALARSAPDRLPACLALEVSYATSANRPHLERLLADVATLPGDVAARVRLVVGHVPKGIYVPTLAKTIRAVGDSHRKPSLHLPELDSDYRALVFRQLELMLLDVVDLKHALAKNGKAAASLLARAKKEGCATLVRGASGSLAQALRNRLGVDLTVGD